MVTHTKAFTRGVNFVILKLIEVSKMKKFLFSILVLSSVLVLAGCKQTPEKEEEIIDEPETFINPIEDKTEE